MLKTLKKLLGIAKDETALQFALDDAIDIVKGYCNIKDIPEGLENTVIRMAMDIYKNENLGKDSDSSGIVTSVKIGDTTTSYQDVRLDSNYNKSILKNYKSILNKYRKMGR